MLDINGWDIRKALRLVHGSNPTLFEWSFSPIVYRDSPFAQQLRQLLARYFSSRSGLWHYLHMAEGNYQEYLRGDRVRAKKYFYVLRPILACRWILEYGTPPPMRFSVLAAHQLDERMKDTVYQLLTQKQCAPERNYIPRIDHLNAYLETSIAQVKQALTCLPPSQSGSWEELDQLFLSVLDGTI